MKKLFITLVAASLMTGLFAQNSTKMDSTSYALGVLMANNLKSMGFTAVNGKDLADGINEFLAGNAKMDMNQAQMTFQKAQSSVHEPNKKAGETFLAENAKRSTVKVTPSGLQYEVMVEGDGVKPSATDEVEVHYHGTLIDGKVFDSSVQRGEKISFPLNQVIPGWTEGLQLMKVGSKYKFFIPWNLAYGDKPAGAEIKPFSALVFEVELFKVTKK
jgi:FKBP-type peptidyl-prolyl cis-trans isomerase